MSGQPLASEWLARHEQPPLDDDEGAPSPGAAPGAPSGFDASAWAPGKPASSNGPSSFVRGSPPFVSPGSTPGGGAPAGTRKMTTERAGTSRGPAGTSFV